MAQKTDTLNQVGQLSVVPNGNELSGLVSLGSGTTGLQIAFEKTADPPNVPGTAQRWVVMSALRQDGSNTLEAGGVASPPAAGQTWLIDTSNCVQWRIRVVALTSGSAGYTAVTSTAPFNTTVAQTTTPVQGSTFRTNAGSAAPGQTLKSFTGFVATSASVATTINLETGGRQNAVHLRHLYFLRQPEPDPLPHPGRRRGHLPGHRQGGHEPDRVPRH